jgi:hypothetical protein
MINEVSETVFVLLVEIIYQAHSCVVLLWHNINTEFHEDWFAYLSNVQVIASTVWESAALIILIRTIYGMCHWDDLSGQRLLTIGSQIQIMYLYYHTNFRGYNVGTTVETDFPNAPLRWPHRVRVTLRLTVSQSVCLGVEPTLWTFDQILLSFQCLGLKFVVLSLWGALSGSMIYIYLNRSL